MNDKMLKLTLLAFIAAVIVSACNSSLPLPRDIVTVKDRYESELLAISGVVGVGIGECRQTPCIKVFVEKKDPDMERRIPKHLEGFEVDIQVTGPVQLLPRSSP